MFPVGNEQFRTRLQRLLGDFLVFVGHQRHDLVFAAQRLENKLALLSQGGGGGGGGGGGVGGGGEREG